MVFKLTEDYLTGIEQIDREHARLIEIINETSTALNNNTSDIQVLATNLLRDYTENHFKHEEEYMHSIGYPELSSQRAAHQAFIEKLIDIDFNDLNFMDDNQQEFLLDLIDYLMQWLSSHILGADKLIGEWKNNRKGGLL